MTGYNAPVGTLPILINAGGVLTGVQTGSGVSAGIPGLLTLNGGTLANGGTSINPTFGTWNLIGSVATAGGPVTSMMTALNMTPQALFGTDFNIPAGTTPAALIC